MAIPAYMSIVGKKQLLITENASTFESVGQNYQRGHEDEVMIQSVRHNIIIPYDPQSGQPTGQRVHNPFVVTKTFDRSSPLLQVALTEGELLTEVVINWYRPTAEGGRLKYYTTTLEDAILVSMTNIMYDCQDATKSQYSHVEELQFSYRKIYWDHLISGTTGEDDWRVPKK